MAHMKPLLFALVMVGLVPAQSGTVTAIDSDHNAREASALTVYNADLALVKERRRVQLNNGLNQLGWRDISTQIQAQTAQLQAISGGPVRVLEQSFSFDLLTPEQLLNQAVGQEVTVIRQRVGSQEELREKATVLSNNQGTILRFADRIEIGVPGRLAFDKLPPMLHERPTLSVLLEASGGAQSLELSYLTGGLSWQADYVGQLSADATQLDLTGWVTLTNRSGTSFQDARLQLVAGHVNQVNTGPAMPMQLKSTLASAVSADVAQQALMDYHLYTVERPISIADNQSKQLAWLSAVRLPVRREYLLTGPAHDYRDRQFGSAQAIHPATFIELDRRGAGLEQELPAGVVRVYAKDQQGSAQFVGEDRIGHTARRETIRLQLGQAFDISAQRKQTEFHKLGNNSAESRYQIVLRNSQAVAVVVKVQEPLMGDWDMVRESHPSRKDAARVATWDIPVAANSTSTLDYTVRLRW